jgi:hypothetical protein
MLLRLSLILGGCRERQRFAGFGNRGCQATHTKEEDAVSTSSFRRPLQGDGLVGLFDFEHHVGLLAHRLPQLPKTQKASSDRFSSEEAWAALSSYTSMVWYTSKGSQAKSGTRHGFLAVPVPKWNK